MKKFITAIIIALLMSLSLGINAFAEEETTVEPVNGDLVTNEVTAPVTAEAIVEELTEPTVIEEVVSQPEAKTEEIIVADAEEVVAVKEAVTEPEAEVEDVIGSETAEKAETAQPVTEPVTMEEPPVCETPQTSYSITFSNGAASFDTVGGTQVAVKDILTGLGYSVENAVITINPDTVDTSVLQITDTENGPVLTDFGPFAEANQKLVVYIDGEAVELSVVDPTDISGDMSASSFIAAFSAFGDLNVRLTDNVNITSGTSEDLILVGKHDLYLNGKTLNLNSLTLTVSNGAALNIYGGASETKKGNGVISNCTIAISGGTIGGSCVYASDKRTVYCSLQDAVTACSTEISLLTDINEYVEFNSGSCSSSEITLDLNGQVLAAATNEIHVLLLNGVTLTIKDGNSENTHTGTYADFPKGGLITGAEQSGIYIQQSSTVNMYGGTIYNNGTSQSQCGGVEILSGTFNMYGGSISNNTSDSSFGYACGGVHVSTGYLVNSIFNMYGGSITGNTASLDSNACGGVYNEGTFNMHGGKITENKGECFGGVYNSGTMTVGGTAKISGNTLTDGTTVSNLYLPSNSVTIGTGTGDGKNGVPVPVSGMSIGVTTYNKPADGNPVRITANGDESHVQYFSSDKNYAVHFSADHLELVNHQHGEWKYSANGAVLTATCCTAGCTLTDNQISITVSANGKSYDGEVYSGASIDNKAFWEAVKLPVPDIVYYAKGQITPLAGAPTSAGVYIAMITVGSAKATCEFTISQKSLTVKGTADGKTYDGTTAAVAHIETVEGLVDTDKGDVTVEIDTAEFIDKDVGNGKDVNISYRVTGIKAGNYTVTGSETTRADIEKRSITLTSGSATKVYDGTPLTNSNVTVSGDGFASGEGAVYTVTGSQTKVGSSSNVFTYKLNSNTESGNYSITKVEGVLTITEKPAPSPAPSPVPAPKEEKSIVVPVEDGGTVLVEAKIVNNKAIVSYFTPETIKNILAGKSATGTVTIDCSNTGSFITEVEIKTANIKTVAESAAKILRVGMNSGFMSLNKGALATITDEAKSDSVVLVIEEISNRKLSTKQQNAVNAEIASKNSTVIAVVDSYILSNASKIKDLGNGKAALEINSENFSSGNSEIVKTGNIIVYEISEDGTMKLIEFEIVDGMIVFEVNRLSQYIVITA